MLLLAVIRPVASQPFEKIQERCPSYHMSQGERPYRGNGLPGSSNFARESLI
jgi:hypothetical protein